MWESVPAVVVDCATFGLAALGGYVALNPPSPEQTAAKRFYLIPFVVLAVVGIGANIWARQIEDSRRTQSDIDLKSAQHNFSEDLKAVKRSSDTILSFVTNPPKGVTAEQAVVIARALTSSRGPLGKLENISNARIADMARAIAVNLNEQAQEWRGDDQNEYMKTTDWTYGYQGTEQNRKDAAELWVKKKKELNERWATKEKDLIGQADEARLEILSRLLPEQRNSAQDASAKSLYEKLLVGGGEIQPGDLNAAASYLDNLWKRLP
jgi:hypothetical protein